MKLRAKFLVLIATMMVILYLLVAAALIPEVTRARLRAQQEQGRIALRTVAAALNVQPDAERAGFLTRNSGRLVASDLSAWCLLDAEDRVVAWSYDTPPPEKLDADARAERGLSLRLPILPAEVNTPPWQLCAAPPEFDFSFSGELWTIFIAMLFGALMLGLATYALVLRLVIHPVERLASASRASAGGRSFPIRVIASARTDELGELIRAYNAMVDEVTGLRQNLEQRVADAVKNLEAAQQQLILSDRLSVAGKLAASVAHEINNPIGGMLNATRALQSKATEGTREAEYLDLILDGLGRIQGIVATMLQFARPSGEKTAVNLGEVLTGALLFSRHRAEQLAVQPVSELPAAALTVTGHRSALGQVFLNLVLNALDALEPRPQAERKLELRLTQDAHFAVVTIRDTGTGMSEDAQAHAGELFFSTKKEGKGTGLGLAIARNIVHDHGGTLSFESKLNAGTVVTVRLPLAAAN